MCINIKANTIFSSRSKTIRNEYETWSTISYIDAFNGITCVINPLWGKSICHWWFTCPEIRRCRICWVFFYFDHYDDVIMTMLASQITSLPVVCSIVYSGVNQRKHQSSASLAFVREIHRGPVNFPHKWPVTRKMFPFDDVIMDSLSKMLRKQ